MKHINLKKTAATGTLIGLIEREPNDVETTFTSLYDALINKLWDPVSLRIGNLIDRTDATI